jgi:NADPH2:quinone reductase
LTEVGGPEVMELREMPDEAPGPREARVRIEACGVNYIDVYHRSGQYPMPLPVKLGAEGAGVVEAVGPEVTAVKVGDRVAWAAVPGSYATAVIASEDKLVPLPEGIDTRTAAAAMLQGMTAHYLAKSTFPLRAGHTCLIHAAAGGVGLLLIQIAKRAGAKVIGTVSTEAKAELALGAGADHVIRYTTQDFEPETKRLTGGRGVDVVYDSVGRETFDESLNCLAPRGMMVLFGQSSGRVPPVDLQVLSAKGSLYATRPTLATYAATRDELLARAGEVLSWVRAGELRVRIGATFPLKDAPQAHRALEGRATTGKVLLIP